MFITSDIIFYRLKEKYSESKSVHKNHSFIDSARIFRDNCDNKSFLYIIDASKCSFDFSSVSGYSFLFFNVHNENAFNLNIGNNDVFFILEEADGYDVIENVFGIFQELSEWDSALRNASVGELNFKHLFSLGESILKRPYCLVDRNFNTPFFSSSFKDELETVYIESTDDVMYKLPHHYAARILSEPSIEKLFKRSAPFLYPDTPNKTRFMCRNIISEGQFIASLAIPTLPDEDWPDSGFQALFMHFYEYIQKAYIRHIGDTYTSHQNNALHKLLRSILFSPDMPLPPDYRDILYIYHWEPEHYLLVVKLQFFTGWQLGISSQYVCQLLEKEWPSSCTLEYEDSIVWIINLTLSSDQLEKQDFHQALAYIVREHICKAGVSEKFTNISALRSYYKQAEYALELGQKNDPYLWYYRFENYIIRYFCEKSSVDFPVERISHKGLQILWKYDIANSTEFTKTLKFYYKYGFNITKAADAMFVHRTTFIRRLEKIKEISGIDPDNTDDMLHILFSFELLDCGF